MIGPPPAPKCSGESPRSSALRPWRSPSRYSTCSARTLSSSWPATTGQNQDACASRCSWRSCRRSSAPASSRRCRSINRRAGDLAFAVVIGLFAAGFVLAVLRNVGVDPIVVVLLLGVVGGALAALVVYRSHGGRLLAGYLAVADLAFVGLFLFGSRTSGARRRRVEPGPRSRQRPRRSRSGRRDRARRVSRRPRSCPAPMARSTPIATRGSPTWRRRARGTANASSQFNLTHRAVPMILEGRIGRRGRFSPRCDDHPAQPVHPAR